MLPRPLFLFLALAAVPAGATAARAEPAPEPACRMTEEPAASPELRANQIADCNYGLSELYRRFTSLLLIPSHRVHVEAVERSFGLSGLHSSYDGRRTAHYYVTLRGSDAGQDWFASLSFVERFDPQGERRVRRFRSTPRAELIDPRYRGDIRISFSLLQPRESAPGTAACFDVGRMLDLVRRLGWSTEVQPVVVSDGPSYFGLRMRRGRMTASTPLAPEGGCLRQVDLMRDADPGAT